jgi:hypothetical protein
MEINDTENNKFMVGLSCSEHKQKLEEKFIILQIEKQLPEGKVIFVPIKKIHTNCVVGNQEDIDEIQSKRP